jgi:hypothetical protein
MTLNHFTRLYQLIKASDEQGILHRPRKLTGYSGEKLIGLLQRLAAYGADLNGGCYLEVGVFQGLTLISTARAVTVETFGIDNFSQFDKGGRNLELVYERMRENDVTNATVINMDYEDALETLSRVLHERTVGTFFVDGPHDYRSQLICLQLIRRHLSEYAVIVVDDCNYRHVRLANRDFLVANPEFKLIFESYTKCHPANMTREEEGVARQGWWNGVNVIARDPAGVLEPFYPPTLRDRTLYENEHQIHAAKYGFVAPEAVLAFSAIRSLNFGAAAKHVVKALRACRSPNRDLVGKHVSLNTFSDALPSRRFNPTCDRAGSAP